MKGITKEQAKKDLAVIEEMAQRYTDAIYGETNFKPGDWEQQFKQVMVGTVCIADNLQTLKMHLGKLADDDMPLVEDEE